MTDAEAQLSGIEAENEQPARQPEPAAFDLYRSLIRLLVGFALVGGDELTQRLRDWEVAHPSEPTTLPGGPEAEPAGDQARRALIGMVFDAAEGARQIAWGAAGLSASFVGALWSAARPVAGSILFLDPGTSYEVQLDLADPDGGQATKTVGVTTRPIPQLPKDGRTLHVAPGSGGGSGTKDDPLRGLAAAQAAAGPGDILLLHTMYWPDEIRDSSFQMSTAEATPEIKPAELEMAKLFVDNLTEPWNPAAFSDHYREALTALLERKARGEIITPEAAPPEAEVVDILSALRASVAAAKAKREAATG